MKATTPVLIAALLLGLLTAAAASATAETIYKWVDEEGVVHYSARPPEGVDFVEMGIELEEEQAPAPAPDTQEAADANRPGEPPEQPEMTETEPDPEMVAERCRQARSNLENLLRRPNITIRGEDGEQRIIDDEERERIIEETQAFIDEWC